MAVPQPPWAGRLAALGVTGVHDLALLPESLLRAAMGVEGAAEGVPVEAWLAEATGRVTQGHDRAALRPG